MKAFEREFPTLTFTATMYYALILVTDGIGGAEDSRSKYRIRMSAGEVEATG